MAQPRRASWVLLCGVLLGLAVFCLISARIGPRPPRSGRTVPLAAASRTSPRAIPPAPTWAAAGSPGATAGTSSSARHIKTPALPVSQSADTSRRGEPAQFLDNECPVYLGSENSWSDQSDSDWVLNLPPIESPSSDPADVRTQPVGEGPQLVEPSEAIASEAADAPLPPEPSLPQEEQSEPSSPKPELVARIPSRAATSPLVDRPSTEVVVESEPADREVGRANRSEHEFADDSWRDPETLLARLKELGASAATRSWATDVAAEVRVMRSVAPRGPEVSAPVLKRLSDLYNAVPQLAAKISNPSLARKLHKTAYALGRRIDVWQTIVKLNRPDAAETAVALDPQKLAVCLADVNVLMGDTAEGRAWRDYLLIDALRAASEQASVSSEMVARRLAQQALARLTQTPLAGPQRTFIATGPVAALRSELRRWAAEPIGAADVLRHIETYERTGLPSDAHRLAIDCQSLALSSNETRRELAARVDRHYGNANLRIAVTAELLNKLIPEQNLEYAPVRDTVVGRPTHGESLMATEAVFRMIPDPGRVLLALEVRGEIASQTTTEAGPVQFHNDSRTTYVARKPIEIDMERISVWPAEVAVDNESWLRGVDTPLDPIPLVSSLARGLAKSGLQQNKSAANAEIRGKVASEASQRIDAEMRSKLTDVVARMNKRVFDPLNSLSLDPAMIEGKTDEDRFTMRLRVAGEDQLGGHTPRIQAPSDSLASVQIHESLLNNGIRRLQLDGRTFTLIELSRHIASRLQWPNAWEIAPEYADVTITFAPTDAVVVRCQEGRVLLSLSIAKLSKSPRSWKNFKIWAFYRPEVQGRSAELVRDGVIHLSGRVSTGGQIALRGIFSHALSKNNGANLVPEQIVKEKRLADAAITQFAIDDGWIGIALGPKPAADPTARRRFGLW